MLPKIIKTFCFFLIFFNISCLQAIDSTIIRFNALGIDDGLADRKARDIIQDKQGYIWIATELGISRFDGSNLKNYEPNANNGLSGSYITALTIDDNETLWIATSENGLNKYQPKTDSFTSFKTSNSDLSSNEIHSLVVDKQHNLWIGTEKGLDRYDLVHNIFTNINHDPADETSLPDSKVRTLLLARNEDLWIGTKKGLAVLDKGSQNIKNIKFPGTEQPFIRTLAEDKVGNIWIGTYQGLYFYHLEKQTISKPIEMIQDPYILSLLMDKSGNLWVGTLYNGVYKFNHNGDYAHYIYDKGNDKSLRGNIVISLFQDDSDIIWIGTTDGIHWFDPENLTLGAHDNSLSSLSCLPSNTIYSALPVSEEELFIGTTSGLSLVNLKTNQCQNFSHSASDTNSISNNSILAIYKDTSDNLWVGTSKGLDHVNIHSSEVTRYGEQLSNKSVLEIKESPDKRLILGTNSGIYISNAEKNQFVLIPSGKPLQDAHIYAMEWDALGNLWVGSNKGLLLINQHLDKVKLFYLDPEVDFITHLRSLYVKDASTLLISIDSRGLFEFDIQHKSLRAIDNELNIQLQSVYAGLTKDSEGYLWLMTLNSGLYSFHPDQPGSSHYQYNDGLASNYVMPRSDTPLHNNRLFFGSRKGFSIFNPTKIKKNNTPAKVSITNLFLQGVQIKPLTDYKSFRTEQSVSNLKTMVLAHDNNTLGFELTAFHYAAPKQNKLAYQLEGVNNNWTTVNAASTEITYDDLSAGEYLFRVKAASKNDVWSEEKTLAVTILPAPWLTWWAFTLYALSAIFAVFYIIKKRTQILTERAHALENTVKQRTSELQDEKHKVEQLLSRKNEEFANVSHEFRTPLTLILGPIAQMLRNHPSEQEIVRLNIVQRNGYRLLRMVDQLLNLETFRIKAITQKSPQATGKTIRLLTEAFADLAEEKNIQLSIKHIEEVNFEFTNDALEKIVLNLLSNAIKYSKAGDSISVETTRTSNNELSIQIIDTGIGIPADKLDTIFERYNRVLDENSEQVTGAGIGLALVKSLVEAHQGRIDIQSKLGKGTQITIYLPIIGEVDASQVSSHANDEIVAMELMGLTNQGASSSDEQIQTEQRQELEHPLQESQKTNVLVIEDNADMRNYIVGSIQDDYQILTARDGVEGLAIATAEVPDLIISDVMMPKMDGYETTHNLRSNDITNHIPIILLTARGDRESRLKGWKNKADEYLTKPFDVEELKIRLKNLLEIRNILKNRFGEIAFQPPKKEQAPKQQSELELSDIEDNISVQQEKFITKLNGIMDSLYADPSTSIAMIASEVAMSERQLFRKLKSILNITPAEYLRRYRLEKSKTILEEGHNIQYAAIEVGFGSQSHFGRCFKAQYGISPKEFKAN